MPSHLMDSNSLASTDDLWPISLGHYSLLTKIVSSYGSQADNSNIYVYR